MRTLVHLGRHGDICTLLPLLWRDNQRGQRSRIMVAAEFIGILEGISYADTVMFDGPYHEIGKACEQAEKLGPYVCTQVNGPPSVVREFVYEPAGQTGAICTSYQKEMWKLAGALEEWDNCYPLVFDKRNKDREHELLLRVLGKPDKRRTKPVLLLALGGTSSPFIYRDIFTDVVTSMLGDRYRVVDISDVKADRIFDLLVLFENAALLIATDSAPLHLARAVPRLPVIALTNDKPILWNGSSWQPQHIAYCRYGDFLKRYRELLNSAASVDRLELPSVPVIHRVWNDYEPKQVDRGFQPGIELLPVELGSCGRDSQMMLKDEKRIPYLKDCLRMGMQRARDIDWVCLTRPDTIMAVGFQDELKPVEAGYAYRMEMAADGALSYAPIIDLFIAKKPWWKAHLAEIPHFLFGSDYHWSAGLWAIFQKHGAKQLPHNAIWRHSKPKS